MADPLKNYASDRPWLAHTPGARPAFEPVDVLAYSLAGLGFLLGLVTLVQWAWSGAYQSAAAIAPDEPAERAPAVWLAGRTTRRVVPALVPHPAVKAEKPTPAQEAYNKGVEAQGKGEHGAAVRHFTETLSQDAKEARALYNRALAHLAAGDRAAAVKDLGDLLRAAPGDVQVLASRGSIRLGMKDYAAAAADFGKMIELKPSSPAYLQRGLAHLHRADGKAAEADFSKAIELDAACAEAHYHRGLVRLEAGRYDDAIADFDRAATLRPTEKVFFERGLAAYHKEDYAAAQRDLSRAVEMDGKDADAHFYLGRVLVRSGVYKKAVAQLTDAIRLGCDRPAAFQRGRAYYLLRDYRRAADDWTAALAAEPDKWQAHYNRASARSELGDHTGALEDLNRVTQLSPVNADAFRMRAGVYRRLGREAEAVADEKQAERLRPAGGK